MGHPSAPHSYPLPEGEGAGARESFKITKEDSGKRIDRYLAEKTGLTRSRVQALIEDGLVLVGGRPVKSNYKIRELDAIGIASPETADTETLAPENIPLKILYSDQYLAVVEKPAGMVVYPAPGHAGGTLMNALGFHLNKLASVGGPLRPGVVHRLDKDTSGVMVVALDDGAYYGLVEQFRKRTIKRSYLALVYGRMSAEKGEIALGVGRSAHDRKKMSTKTGRGKEALTSWEAIERYEKATLLRARLGTGRTHQIRVHFSAIGHPVLGDKTYGKKVSLEVKDLKSGLKKPLVFPRQMLHAELLGFTHPITGEYLEFRMALPVDMEDALRGLRAV